MVFFVGLANAPHPSPLSARALAPTSSLRRIRGGGCEGLGIGGHLSHGSMLREWLFVERGGVRHLRSIRLVRILGIIISVLGSSPGHGFALATLTFSVELAGVGTGV